MAQILLYVVCWLEIMFLELPEITKWKRDLSVSLRILAEELVGLVIYYIYF